MLMPHTHKKIILLIIITAFLALIIGIFLINRKVPPIPETVTLAHDKGDLPFFRENFIKQGKMSGNRTGISIQLESSVMPDLYIHQMKATLPTKEAPELFTWWSQFRVKELIDNHLVGDLTEKWDKYINDYPAGMREAFTFDGKVYGFPYAMEYWVVWYNKSIFKRQGLSKPSTWTEFIHICNTLKASGVTPILSSLQYDWPSFIWFEEMIIGEDPDLYRDLCLGRAKYTDPRVIKACTVWKDMIEKGYFTDPSFNMMTNGGYLWNNEKFAMVLCGTWYDSGILLAQGVDENDLGLFILPSHNPDAGKNIVFEVGPLFTAKNAKKAACALKVADWWMSPEGNGYFARIHHTYPSNMKSDTDYLPPQKKRLLDTIKNENYRLVNRYWEATPASIGDTAVLKLGEFILNPAALHQILTDIDRAAEAHWAPRSH